LFKNNFVLINNIYDYVQDIVYMKYLRLLRPKQWVKNLLIFLGVLSSGNLTLLHTAILVFVTFCIASSTAYVYNDLRDVDSDRLHHRKKRRPIASGAISLVNAWILLLFLLTVCLFSFAWLPLYAYYCILVYLLGNILYSSYLKRIPIVDIYGIAFFFFLRVMAGTMGINIQPSVWLIITVIAVSVFLAVAKRYGELRDGSTRDVLKYYTVDLCRGTLFGMSTLATAFYSLYIIFVSPNLFRLVTIPLVMFGFTYYFMLVEQKTTDADPTVLLYKSKILQVAAITITILFALGR